MSFINPSTEVISLFTTTAQCDEATASMQAEKDDLVYDQLVNEHKSTSAIASSAKVDADLSAAKTTKTSLEAVIASLPANSPIKEGFQNQVTVLTYKIFNLEKRAARLGGIALMKYKVINDGINSRIAEFNTILASIVTKRATL
jgi:hypothetical protein